ncbi:MAG: AMP-binding protein, partial [Bacillota bacterium]|nr:AMP-binding protein [Bacillota bacterium]
MNDIKPWLTHYPEEIPPTLEYAPEPVQHYLEKAASEFPNKVAIHFLGKEITYKQLLNQTVKFAGYLQEIGITKDDRVAIMLPNTPQAVICYYGILMAGGIVVQT